MKVPSLAIYTKQDKKATELLPNIILQAKGTLDSAHLTVPL